MIPSSRTNFPSSQSWVNPYRTSFHSRSISNRVCTLSTSSSSSADNASISSCSTGHFCSCQKVTGSLTAEFYHSTRYFRSRFLSQLPLPSTSRKQLYPPLNSPRPRSHRSDLIGTVVLNETFNDMQFSEIIFMKLPNFTTSTTMNDRVARYRNRLDGSNESFHLTI